MRAMQRSQAAEDMYDEVTLRRGALASVHPIEAEVVDDGVDVAVDDGWDDESAPVSFFIEGDRPAVVRLQKSCALVTQAQGVVKRIEEDRLLLGTPGIAAHEVALSYRLPASVDLRALVGRRVRLTLVDEPSRGGGSGQTLTIATLDGRVWLVARYGGAREVTHTLAGAPVRVTLSPKVGGPLVIAPPDLQHIVAPGGDARMKIGQARFVVEVVSRDEAGKVAYFIADALLWH